MSLGENIVAGVRAAFTNDVRTKEAGEGKKPVTVNAEDAEGKVRLSLDAHDADRYSVVLVSMRVATDVETSVPVADLLRRQADAIVERVGYLSETFVVVEFDTAGLRVQLRSAAPERTDGAIAYFEIELVDGREIRFGRFRSRAGAGGREKMPQVLPLMTLQQLAEDLRAISLQHTEAGSDT